MATAVETAKPDLLLLQWFVNDVQPQGDRSLRTLPLAGPFHRFVQPYSALYYIANRGFAQIQRDQGWEPSSADYYARFADPAGADAIAARNRLEAALDVPAAAGVPYRIALWPSMTDQETGYMSDDALFVGVLEVCVARRLSCLDLRPRLRTLPADTPLVVSEYDPHPSAAVNGAVADALAEWLSSDPIPRPTS